LERIYILPTMLEKNRKIQAIILAELRERYQSMVLEPISRRTDVQKLSYIGGISALNGLLAYSEYESCLEKYAPVAAEAPLWT
jgi:cellulose biosynthesis protein BcsQ